MHRGETLTPRKTADYPPPNKAVFGVGLPITIDGKQFALDDLSAAARSQIVNLRVTDQEIARLQTQLAIAQTARAAYAQALSAELQSGAPQKGKQK